MKTTATIGIYGNREVGFAFLADFSGNDKVFGDYEPASAKLAHEDMTSALFAACDALRARGVTGRARVSFDRKRSDGRTVVRSAEIDIASPPWAGSLNWKEVVL